MAQDGTTAGGASYSLDNVTFPVGRNKLQSIFDAIRSTNKGNTAPDLVAGQFWIDDNTPSTTVWTLYFYDGTDSIQFATIDTINNTVNFIDSTFDLINDTTPELGGNLSTNGNDINFGDNDKAQFGASNDLQIYHDSGNSIISESGQGSLVLKSNGAGVYIQTDTSESMASFAKDSAVTLYHNNNPKIATTSTGIDVTGTVVSDGLTVDNGGTNSSLQLGGTYNYKLQRSSTDGALEFKGFQLAFSDFVFKNSYTADAQYLQRMRIGSNGDISFYEDTGTTPKLFWDASAERLGIGTTSPSGSLTVEGDYLSLRVENTNTSSTGNAWQLLLDDDSTVNQGDANNSQLYIASARPTSSTGNLIKVLNNGKSNTAFILKDNGNIGIGTSSPAKKLHISSGVNDTPTTFRIENTDTTIETAQEVNAIEFYTNDSSGGGTGVTAKIAQVAFNPGNQYDLAFSTYNLSLNEAMRIVTNGNVGIGTSSPASKLHIDGSGLALRLDGTANTSRGIILRNTGTAEGQIQTDGNMHFIQEDAGRVMKFSTANTERMRIDSSGRVGIGASNNTSYDANAQNFLLASSGNTGMTIRSAGATPFAMIHFADGTTDNDEKRAGRIIYQHSTDTLSLHTANSERMRIDSSGNVGIGVTGGFLGSGSLAMERDKAIRWQDDSDGTLYADIYGSLSGELILRTGSSLSEAMRIDSSGRLLVGKTVADNTTAGGSIFAGVSSFVNDGGRALTLVRKTSDGDLVEFRKDTTTVGRIGSSGGVPGLYIGDSTVALTFYNGANLILPSGGSSLTKDGDISLGNAFNRFNNLYLAGSVYLGGTGSANALDDYETGTWTPVDGSGAGLSFTVSNATYTKVGRIVTCYAQVDYPSNSNGSTGQIGGLPFTNIVGSGSNHGAFTVYTTKPDVTWLNTSGGAGSQSFDTNGLSLSNASLSGKQFRLVWVYAEN